MPPGSASIRLWAGCVTPLATCANSFTRRGLTSKGGWRGEARPGEFGWAWSGTIRHGEWCMRRMREEGFIF